MSRALGLCILGATIIYVLSTEGFEQSLSRAIASVRLPVNTAAPASPRTISQPTNNSVTSVELKTAQLAQEMDRLQTSPRFDRETESFALSLNQEDAVTLRHIALNSGLSHNERFLAVFLLAQRPAEFTRDLEAIAASDSLVFSLRPTPHTEQELKRHFESSLRVQALSALDSLSPQGNQEAAFFASLQDKHSDGFVRKLARMGRVGAEQGRSLIAEYIEAKQNGVGYGVED